MSVKFHDILVAGTPEVATTVEAGNVKPVTSNGVKAYVDAGLSGKQNTLTFDSTPTAGSNNPVTSDGIKNALSTIPIPRPNLLDNWYFVGGGSQQGNEQLPINNGGLTTYYNSSGAIDTIDRWKTSAGITITTESDGLLIESSQGSEWKFQQSYESGFRERIKGKEVTFSILFKGQTTGDIAACIFTNEGNHVGNFETSASGIAKVTYTIPNNITDFRCVIYGHSAFHAKIIAAKLELGDTQTLAHQENGQWVLNEIPNYYEQLLQCSSPTISDYSLFRREAFKSSDTVPSIEASINWTYS